MGYGKTTAVKEFFTPSSSPVFWLRVYDSSAATFWKGLTDLFDGIDSSLSKKLSKLGVPNDPIMLWKAMKLMGNTAFSSDTVIVIDDYHLLNSPEIDRFLGMLAENELDHLHLVLIMRYSRFQRLEELSLKGLLHHITQEPFEFHTDEIKAYYQSCGVYIDERQSSELYSMTEGWVSALYLMMLEYVEDGSLALPENIYKLMEKAVYNPLSDEQKAFILAMSIFDSFTLEQAQSMWEDQNTGDLLTEIINKNALVSYDSRSKTYHIHGLFREYLQDILNGKQANELSSLYRKAARWALTNGNYAASQEFFYRCGDFEGILSSMEQETAKRFTPEHKDVLKKYIGECPEEIRKRHPYALFVLAVHLFTHQDLEPFYQICREIENNLQTDESLDEARKTQLRGELELLYGGLKYNDLKKMTAHFNKAWALLGRPTAIFKDLTDWNMGSPSILGLYHRESGKLDEEVSDMLVNMECYDRLSGGHASGGEYLMEAEGYFNRGDFENAEISLHKAVNRAQAAGNHSIRLCSMFLQIRLAFIRDDAEALHSTIENMRRQITQTSKYQTLQMVKICEMAFHAYFDQTVNLSEILDPAEGQGVKLRFFTLPVFNIVYGRILLNGGEYLKLIGSADQFFSVAAVFPNLLGSIYTYIYLAAANHRIFREKDAMDSLQKALDLALPDQLLMPFVENCDYITPLLRSLSGYERFQADIEKILALHDIYAPLKEAFIRDYLSDGRPVLTDRELNVARLVSEGLTNREISRRLFISVNTVKAALKSIYAKLSINNRMHLKEYIDRASGDA